MSFESIIGYPNFMNDSDSLFDFSTVLLYIWAGVVSLRTLETVSVGTKCKQEQSINS